MNTQCSIWECRTLAGEETFVHSLNGGGDAPSAYRTSWILKRCRGFVGFAQRGIAFTSLGYSAPYFATLFDYWSAMTTRYGTQTDAVTDRSYHNASSSGASYDHYGTPDLNYTGVSSFDANLMPEQSGYASGVSRTAVFVDPFTGWVYGSWELDTFTTFPSTGYQDLKRFGGFGMTANNGYPLTASNVALDASGNSLAETNWSRTQSHSGSRDGVYSTIVQTLSDQIDYSADYDAAKAALEAVADGWLPVPVYLEYDEPDLFFTKDVSLTGFDAGDYTLDVASAAGSMVVGGIYWNETVGGWAYNLNGEAYNPTLFWGGCRSGWALDVASAGNASAPTTGLSFRVFVGTAKNKTGATASYFIARMRLLAASPGYPYVPSDATSAGYILSAVSSGDLASGQYIGPGGTVELPGPGTEPFPLTNVGGELVVSDWHFVVIGQTLTAWATENGLTVT